MKHDVHVYREMRLFYSGVEAETPDQAAEIADCDGFNLSAQVDRHDDRDFTHSVHVTAPDGPLAWAERANSGRDIYRSYAQREQKRHRARGHQRRR
ncbi:MAG: hypothetical protein AB7F35_27440 [Acetobacteraceae bacterium]